MTSSLAYRRPASKSVYEQSKSQYGSHGGHCVCQICTCSKHKCPPSMLPYSPDSLLSTMKNDYPAHPVNRSLSQKKAYQYEPSSYSPDLLKTTNQSDYTPKKYNAPYRHQKQVAVANNMPFEGESEYHSNYLKNYVPPYVKQSAPNAQTVLSNSPFQGESTYTDAYKGSPVQKRTPIKPQHLVNTNIPFEGNSTYNHEYKAHEVPKYQTHHKNPYQPNLAPFEGNTSYQDEYKRYGQETYQKETCPVVTLPQLPRNCSPGKAHLHFNDQTQQWD